MKKNMIVSALLLISVLFLMLFGFDMPSTDTATPRNPVLLLVEKDTGAFVMQFRQGAQAAASEQGWELQTEVVSMADFQSDVLRFENRSFSGALLLVEDSALQKQALTRLADLGITAVLVDAIDSAYRCVATDKVQKAALAASYALPFDTVYLMGGDDAMQAAALAELSPRQVCLGGEIAPARQNACVLALDEATAVALGLEKQSGRWQHPLICSDPGEDTRVTWLEDGTAQAMIFESPYAMGYEAAAVALWSDAPAAFLTASTLVTKETMYAPESVKLVFPLLH